jgi:hypothetical protein
MSADTPKGKAGDGPEHVGRAYESAPGPVAEGPLGPVGIRWDATPIRNSAPPVRILGTTQKPTGRYRLDR